VSGRKHIFIVTYGRSGSTLLQALLNTMEHACIRGENSDSLLFLFRGIARAKESVRVHGQKQTKSTNPWFGAELIDANKLTSSVVRAFIEHVLRPPADAKIVGFKEIRYNECQDDEFRFFVDFLLKNFEHAKVIFLQRQVETVAGSGWWKNMEFEAVAKIISRMDKLFDQCAATSPAQTRIVRYEEMVADIEYVRGIFEFVGEPMNEAAVTALFDQKLSH
jgi:hypothetical protein